MTASALAKVREIEAAMTPGPWGDNLGGMEQKTPHPTVEDAPLDFYAVGKVVFDEHDDDQPPMEDADMQAIALARNLLPHFLALWEAAEALDAAWANVLLPSSGEPLRQGIKAALAALDDAAKRETGE